MKKNTTDKFLIGSWVSFYSFEKDSFQAQLDQMKKIGFNFNIFPMVFCGSMMEKEIWDKTEAEYAKRDMYYLMWGGMNGETVKDSVALAKDKAHCIGYHIVDEPFGEALPAVAKICKAFHEEDSERYPFVNLFPCYAGEKLLGGTYLEHVSNFVREVGAENLEYLSHDYYSFHEDGTDLNIFGDMEVIRKVALENGGLRTHAFPQSTAWKGMRMPDINDMKWNVYGYLAYGFKGLSWFNLVCPGSSDEEGEWFRESVIYRDGEIHDKKLFEDFIDLNHEIVALGDTLMKLDCLHAYHTKEGVKGVELLPENWMVSPDKDANLIVSHMVSRENGDTYFMLYNKDHKNEQTASIDVKECSNIEYLNPFTENWEVISLENGTFNESFRAGEGKLYRFIE